MVFVKWIQTTIGIDCFTVTPANLGAYVPCVEIDVIGGSDTAMVIDGAIVDVFCWDTTRNAALTLAEEVREQIRFTLPGSHIDGGVVSKVTTALRPVWLTYDNINLNRFHAVYQIFMHAHK